MILRAITRHRLRKKKVFSYIASIVFQYWMAYKIDGILFGAIFTR